MEFHLNAARRNAQGLAERGSQLPFLTPAIGEHHPFHHHLRRVGIEPDFGRVGLDDAVQSGEP